MRKLCDSWLKLWEDFFSSKQVLRPCNVSQEIHEDNPKSRKTWDSHLECPNLPGRSFDTYLCPQEAVQESGGFQPCSSCYFQEESWDANVRNQYVPTRAMFSNVVQQKSQKHLQEWQVVGQPAHTVCLPLPLPHGCRGREAYTILRANKHLLVVLEGTCQSRTNLFNLTET